MAEPPSGPHTQMRGPEAGPERSSAILYGKGCATARTPMTRVRHFRELGCWQLACELKAALGRFVEGPQVQRDFTFCSQVRDAAASLPRTIAEGFGRRTRAEFALSLDSARASLGECQAYVQDALDHGYLSPDDFKTLSTLAERTCGAVAELQRRLGTP